MDSSVHDKIADHLAQLANEKSLAVFVSHDGEPDLLTRLADYGSDLFLPRVISDTEMEFARYEPSERMVPNRFGINEPMTPSVEPREIEAIAVPGLAFDRFGGRVGFGAGFYDRWLKMRRSLGDVSVYAVGFHWQIVGEIFLEKHDQRVDAIVTENGIIEVTS